MRHILAIGTFLVLLVSSTKHVEAQVRFTVNGGGWGYQPGVTVSVGNGNGWCGPGYRNPYPVYVNRGYYRRPYYNQGYYQNNCPPPNPAVWCGAHRSYCTHQVYGYNNNQAYWCRAHNEYCTHR